MMGNIIYYLLGVSILGLGYSFWKYYQLSTLEAATAGSSSVGKKIKGGALQYMQSEYKILLLFVISIALLLFFKGQSESESNGMIALSYIIGAGMSALAGYLGILLLNDSNLMTANESRVSFLKGFRSAINGASAIGIANAALMVFGLTLLLILYSSIGIEWSQTSVLNVLAGFALGASTVSLFARFGGGLFSKSAEFADSQIQLSESGIKSNSMHNPASTANDIGNGAILMKGFGADLFESFSATILATMLIGISFLTSFEVSNHLSMGPVLVPLAIAAVGIITSAGAIFLLSGKDQDEASMMMEITEGAAAFILIIATFFITKFLLPTEWSVSKESEKELFTTTYYSLGIFWSALFGILASVAIGKISPLFTDSKSMQIKNSAVESGKGSDSNFIAGLQNGFLAIGLPVLLIVIVSVLSYYFAGYYGLGIAATGMLSNMGFYYAKACLAPISDNSSVIAIKAAMSEDSVKNTAELKKFGQKNMLNTRTFVIVAASLSVLTLFSAFMIHSGIELVNMYKPLVIAGIIMGALLPFILSSTTLTSINKLVQKMISETKRQFKEIPPLAEAKEILDKHNGDLSYATEGEKEIVFGAIDDVDSKRLAEMTAFSTVWETIIPGAVAIAVTALIGYFAGIEILAGFLLGNIASGIMLSLFLTNSGNTYESTKTAFENGVNINGELHGTGTNAYQYSTTGDKVGKPMKDAIAPSIVVIMKLILVTALIISSALISRELSKKGLHVENLNKTEFVNKV